MNYLYKYVGQLTLLFVITLSLSCSSNKMSKNPVFTFEKKEVFDKQDIYLVAFEIINDNRLILLNESLKEQVRMFSNEYSDSLNHVVGDRELHYYFYSTGAKIPPFSRVNDYTMVDALLWVDVKSFDSPLLEWTNKFDSTGLLYEWKLE